MFDWTVVLISFLLITQFCTQISKFAANWLPQPATFLTRLSTIASASSGISRGHQPGPKSGCHRHLLLLQLCKLVLIGQLFAVSFFSFCDKGEGSESTMRFTEAADHWQEFLPVHAAKPHGTQPAMSLGSPFRPQSCNQIQKRSLYRARRRAHREGIAWYKGKCYTSSDFDHMFQTPLMPSDDTPTCPTALSNLKKYNHAHASKRRLTSMSWNPGGLSAAKLDEVKCWGETNLVDVMVFSETRWTFTGDWMDSSWLHVHSGLDQGRGMGVLILISRRICNPGNLQWNELQPGRLLHVRIPSATRHIDILGCYQYTNHASQNRRQERMAWWNQLDNYIQHLPRRNTLLLLGDFNCSLPELPGLCGAPRYKWRAQLVTGAQHPDSSELCQVVKTHGLCVLNSWDATQGPTYFKDFAHSRIDFCMTRLSHADGASRQVKHLWSAPFLPQPFVGHVPLFCTIPKVWIPRNHSNHAWISKSQIHICRQEHELQTSRWQALQTSLHQTLTGLSQEAVCPDETLLTAMHQAATQGILEHYPQGALERPAEPWRQAMSLTSQKWHHRSCLVRTWKCSLKSILNAWYHFARFKTLDRQLHKFANQARKAKFLEVTAKAQEAADRHDIFQLFQLINKHAPKNPRRPVQLRTSNGTMASPIEELAMLTRYVQETWSGPRYLTLPSQTPPGVPFCLPDLVKALQGVPSTKSVARPFAPGIIWKSLAVHVAPIIFQALQVWWNVSPPYIPDCWRDGWLLMIPKPAKPASAPSNLRPLALQEPIGKAIMGILNQLLLQQCRIHLIQWPLWAYIPQRSTQDALRRVVQHCMAVRTLINSQRPNVYLRANSVVRHAVCGGFQLFLDLERAFDNVDRVKLFSRLYELDVDSSLITLLTAWHSNTRYHVGKDDQTRAVSVGRGVRQGCKIAPSLWNAFVLLFLHDLASKIGTHWILQCLNIYADDCHIGCIFHSQIELDFHLNNLGIVLSTLRELGLSVNLRKSEIQLAMTGTNYRTSLQALRHRDHTGTWMKIILPNHDTLQIPLTFRTKYLGAIMSYTKFEDQTLAHRIKLSHIAFQRLRRWLCKKNGLSVSNRVKLWRTCVFPVLHYGLVATGISDQGLHRIQQTIFQMLRLVTSDHAYITGHTHQQALQIQQIELPLQQLRAVVASFLRSTAERTSQLAAHDILWTVSWDHLPALELKLIQILESGPPVRIQTTRVALPETQALYQCPHCDFCTPLMPNYRRHLTVQHGLPQHRIQHAPTSQFTTNGLPTCRFCNHAFQSWRAFQSHIDRGCAQADSAAMTHRFGAASQQARMEAAVRGSRMLTDPDLANLKSKSFGETVLTIVRTRNWQLLRHEAEACEYLSKYCFLCGHFAGRCQNMNLHLRTVHEDLWEHVVSKGTQLTNQNAGESPCDYCGSIFKSTHMCNVFTQIAVMLVNGAGLPAHSEPQDVPALMCELCHEHLDDAVQLHDHLQQRHGLVSGNWNVSQDSVEGNPACAHCGSLHVNLEGLRSHIVQGKCKYFNPNLTSETQPVDPALISACVDGQLLQVIKDSKLRMALTLSCQCCGKTYSRVQDLANHLQTAHAALWHRSLQLTSILVAMIYDHLGCICNPAIGQHRLEHICAPHRQLAMQYLRQQTGPFRPSSPTEQDLQKVLATNLPREVRFHMEKTLTSGPLRDWISDVPTQQILAETCICCGLRVSSPVLNAHVREAHCHSHETIAFYVQDLLPFYITCNVADHRCFACDQIFNVPCTGTDPDAAREKLVQSHFTAQCPCLVQTAVLLTALIDERSRDVSCRPIGGFLQPAGPVVYGLRPEARGKSKRTQAQASGSGTNASQTSRATRRRRTTPGQNPADHVPAPDSTRSRPPPAEARRLLCALFQQGANGRPPAADPTSSELAPGDGDQDGTTQPDAVAAALDEEPAGGTGQQNPTSGQSQEGGRTLEAGDSESADARGWELALSPVGSPPTKDHPLQEDPSQHAQNVGTHPRAAGDDFGSHNDSEIPRPPEQHDGADSSMAAATPSTAGCSVQSLVPAQPLCGLATIGGLSQASFPDQKSFGESTPGIDGQQELQGKGQRQGTEILHCAQAGGMSSYSIQDLLAAMSVLILANDGNWCYMNAMFNCSLWALLTVNQSIPSEWGTFLNTLADFLFPLDSNYKELHKATWMKQVLLRWGAMNCTAESQQDSAECVMMFLEWLKAPALDLSWERRCEINGRTEILDTGTSCMPIRLQFTDTHDVADPHTYVSLRSLVEAWHQVDGMYTSLLHSSTAVCFHVDRFMHTDGNLTKCNVPLDFHGETRVPIFMQDTLKSDQVDYLVAAAMAHFGGPDSGHYRALLRIQPCVHDGQPAEWLLTDDNCRPQAIWNIPIWFSQNITFIWMIRADTAQFHTYRGHTVPTAEQALLDLLPPVASNDAC